MALDSSELEFFIDRISSADYKMFRPEVKQLMDYVDKEAKDNPIYQKYHSEVDSWNKWLATIGRSRWTLPDGFNEKKSLAYAMYRAVFELPGDSGRLPYRLFMSSNLNDSIRRFNECLLDYLRKALQEVHSASPEVVHPTGPEPKTGIQEAATAILIQREGVFFAGQQFDALAMVSRILNQAESSIDIVDGYVNETTLSLCSQKKPHVVVNILVKKHSDQLRILAEAFNVQYGKLSLRASGAFHDRFVVIDETEYYHFGATLKDLGKSGFMFSRLEEPEVLTAFVAKWKQVWSSASPIV